MEGRMDQGQIGGEEECIACCWEGTCESRAVTGNRPFPGLTSTLDDFEVLFLLIAI